MPSEKGATCSIVWLLIFTPSAQKGTKSLNSFTCYCDAAFKSTTNRKHFSFFFQRYTFQHCCLNYQAKTAFLHFLFFGHVQMHLYSPLESHFTHCARFLLHWTKHPLHLNTHHYLSVSDSFCCAESTKTKSLNQLHCIGVPPKQLSCTAAQQTQKQQLTFNLFEIYNIIWNNTFSNGRLHFISNTRYKSNKSFVSRKILIIFNFLFGVCLEIGVHFALSLLLATTKWTVL